jgi:hypothetical protein
MTYTHGRGVYGKRDGGIKVIWIRAETKLSRLHLCFEFCPVHGR